MGSSVSAPFFAAMAVLANFKLCPFFFALAIGIPSALLYCSLLLIIVINSNHFSSSFFILVFIRAILSLINYIVSFLAHRFGKIGLFLPIYLKFPRLLLAFLFFMVFYAFHLENLLTAFLLLNRLSAILFPMKYKKLWRVGLPFVVAFSFILPLPFTVPIFSFGMYVHVQSDNATFTLDNNTTKNHHLSFAEFGHTFGLQIAQHYQQNGQHAANERKMTIYTVATFFGQLLMAIFMIIRFITATHFVDEHNIRRFNAQEWFNMTLEQTDTLYLANFNQYPWVNDLSTVVIPSWLLLWASSKLREIFFIKLKKIPIFAPNIRHLKLQFSDHLHGLLCISLTILSDFIIYSINSAYLPDAIGDFDEPNAYSAGQNSVRMVHTPTTDGQPKQLFFYASRTMEWVNSFKELQNPIRMCVNKPFEWMNELTSEKLTLTKASEDKWGNRWILKRCQIGETAAIQWENENLDNLNKVHFFTLYYWDIGIHRLPHLSSLALDNVSFSLVRSSSIPMAQLALVQNLLVESCSWPKKWRWHGEMPKNGKRKANGGNQ
ncbi:hypothetical protein niasHT_014024 [Heterodera trifolii]|uniref:Serpentine receptor class gamma n=1 Tax=Heterodera trifolii TaxID=157864 RepID=A0ABD2KYN8_9BILA